MQVTTSIPLFRNSTQSPSPKMMLNAFVDEYVTRPGAPCKPARDDIRTMPPRRRDRMSGANARISAMGLRTFTAIACSMSEVSVSRKEPRGICAALQTTTPTSLSTSADSTSVIVSGLPRSRTRQRASTSVNCLNLRSDVFYILFAARN